MPRTEGPSAHPRGTVGRSARGTGGVGTGVATVTRTVDVTLTGMRVRPSRIEVAAGTVLRLEVTNEDAQRHDRQVDDGPATPAPARGRSHILDVGRITEDRQAWCSCPDTARPA